VQTSALEDVGEVEAGGEDGHQPRERKLVMYNLRMRAACLLNKVNPYQETRQFQRATIAMRT
jgi:hypothetical protein